MSDTVVLREVTQTDLPVFFEHQQEPTAVHMAAFTAEDPADKDAFEAHWTRILSDDTVTVKTILLEGHVAGHVAKFERDGTPEVTYWVGRDHWGRGVATKALTAFLDDVGVRPIYARAARDNVASLRVLEKCGFAVTGYESGFANARGREIEEAVLKLA